MTDRGQLVGVLSMRDLLLAAPRDPIDKIVRRDVVSVVDTMDREDVIDLMSKRCFVCVLEKTVESYCLINTRRR